MEQASTSPTDRIEQLLNKYKARYNLSTPSTSSAGTSKRSSPLVTPRKSDAFSHLWDAINKELRAHGFAEVKYTFLPSSNNCVLLDELASQSLAGSLTTLLEELEHKQSLIQQLLASGDRKESALVKQMRDDSEQAKETMKRLNERLSTKTAQYKELEKVHTASLQKHHEQMEAVKKSHTDIVVTCQGLERKCVEQDSEIAKLRMQLTNIQSNLKSHEVRCTSSTPATPTKAVRLQQQAATPPNEQTTGEVNVLRLQLNDLKYRNTKLLLDLQNRPERQELRQSQKRINQLEQELDQCKALLTSEQKEIYQVQKHLEGICSVLKVKDVNEIVPKLEHQLIMLGAMKDMEKCLTVVVELLGHPSAPQVQDGNPPRDHMIWCHYSWDHVVPTLKHWLRELSGLKELYGVFADVCNTLKLRGLQRNPSNDSFDRPSITCKQMSALLRSWLLKDSNRKVVQQQALVAMVAHYQKLFDVHWVGGVYASMSKVAMTLEECQIVLRTMKSVLHLDEEITGRQLVAIVEGLANNRDSRLMPQIVQLIGVTDPNEVLERLKLYENFFPAFHQVITEVQDMLGVTSLASIAPAIQMLQRRAVK